MLRGVVRCVRLVAKCGSLIDLRGLFVLFGVCAACCLLFVGCCCVLFVVCCCFLFAVRCLLLNVC